MADQPAKHGHQHGPDGPDPIPVTSGGDLIWALAGGAGSATDTGTLSYRTALESAYTNSPSDFSADADWLKLTKPGYYVAKFIVYKNSGGTWVNTDDTRINPLFETAGSVGGIQDNQGVADFLGDWYNPRAQSKSGDEHDLGLATDLTFHWDPDNVVSDLDQENPLKLSVEVVAPAEGTTISMGFSIWVMRIAAPGYTDITPS